MSTDADIRGPAPARTSEGARETLIVVGNGMVSHRFCDRLTSVPERRFRVIVFGEEEGVAYDRIRLTSVFGGVEPAALSLSARAWYDERGIDLRLGEAVEAIDLQARVVRTSRGASQPFDRLVLATGATPKVPPIDGLDDPGILLYRNLADASRITQAARRASSAAVLGGGLLGLEAAQGLRDLGLKVCVLEAADFLMPRQLDPEGGARLAAAMTAQGIDVHLGKRTRSVRKASSDAEAARWTLTFDAGEALEVDLVVLAAGVRPHDALARAAGLRCGADGGVIIDDTLATSSEGVYAMGDCALFKGVAFGLVAPGYEMADVLAKRLRGETAVYRARSPSTRLKVAGVEVSVLGDITRPTAHPVVAANENGYRKLFVQKGVVVGALGVGAWPERDCIERAIHDKRFVWRWHLRRYAKQGTLFPDEVDEGVATWPDSATVCHCVGVTCGQLRAALAAGCRTPAALTAQTAAGTVCGSCKPELEELVGLSGASFGRWLAPGLLRLSVVAGVLALLHVLLAPVPLGNTIEGPGWEVLWRDKFVRQVSGFSLLGVAVLALSLSLRKRWKALWGTFAWWRGLHAGLGIACLLGLVVHTGLHKGDNFNQWLYANFLGLNVLGAAAGAWLAKRARTRRESRWQQRVRWLHVALLVPLPALLAFHILAVYAY